MPIFDGHFTVQVGKGQELTHSLPLVQIGPILQVQIEVPKVLAARLESEGKAVPPPATGIALIDTGATISAVTRSVIDALGLQPIRTVSVGHADGVAEQGVFTVQWAFPGTDLPRLITSALGANLERHTMPLPQGRIIALVGRDILASCILIYNGRTASYSLAY